MNTKDKSMADIADRLNAAADVLGMLSSLFSAMGKLDGADVAGLAKVGRYMADDWANALNVDAEQCLSLHPTEQMADGLGLVKPSLWSAGNDLSLASSVLGNLRELFVAIAKLGDGTAAGLACIGQGIAEEFCDTIDDASERCFLEHEAQKPLNGGAL